jgi:hypothetical protein
VNRRINFTDVGETLSDGWGWSSNGTIDDKIKDLDADTKILCLLAGILRRLRRMDSNQPEKDLLERIFGRKPSLTPVQTSDSTADALLAFYRKSVGDKEITDDELQELSVRARTSLKRAKFRYYREVNAPELREIRNCGVTTIQEIMEWREKHLANRDSSHIDLDPACKSGK